MSSWDVASRFERGDRNNLSELDSRLYEALVVPQKKNSIRLEDFEGIYSPEEIRMDLEKIRQREKDMSFDVIGYRGEVFEAVINDQIESSNWLGDNATAITPSRYDDYFNGVDSIISFPAEDETSYLALSIDITSSRESVSEKFARTKRGIDNGDLNEIKYYATDHPEGRKTKVAKLIVGADRTTIEEVGNLILRFRVLKKNPQEGANSDFKKVRQQLAEHPMQFKLLFAIKSQLINFKKYAESGGHMDLAKKYDELLQIINPVIATRESEAGISHSQALSLVDDDDVYQAIIAESKKIGTIKPN